MIEKSEKQGWLICLSGSLFFFFQFLQMNLGNSISLQAMNLFHISHVQLGYISASYLFALIILFFPAGLLLDRYSTRRLMLSALFVSIIGAVIFSFASTLFMFIVARILMGAAHAFAFVGSIRLAKFWIPSRVALAIGVVAAVGLLGGVVAQTPVALSFTVLGWHITTLILVGLGIIIWLVMYFVLKDSPLEKTVDHMSISSQFMQVLPFAQNWLCAIYAALLNLPVLLLGALWGNTYLIHHVGLTTSQAANTNMMIYIGMIVGAPLLGWLSDYAHKRRLVMWACNFLALCLLLGVIFMPSFEVIIFLCLFFLLGLFISTQVLAYAVVADINNKAVVSTATGFVSIIIMGLGAILQPVIGHSLQNNIVGSYNIVMYVIMGALIINMAIALRVQEPVY